MAKTKGIIQIRGSIGDMVYYQLDGKSIARRKYDNQSSVFSTSEAYEKQRAMSKLFTASNAMATAIYRMAKDSGAELDYRQHSKLVKVITKRFNQPDVDLQDLHFGYLRGVLEGIRLDKMRSALPVSFHWREGALDITSNEVGDVPMLVQLYKGKLVCPQWKGGKYVCETDMQSVEVIEIELGSGEVVRVNMGLGDDEVTSASLSGRYSASLSGRYSASLSGRCSASLNGRCASLSGRYVTVL